MKLCSFAPKKKTKRKKKGTNKLLAYLEKSCALLNRKQWREGGLQLLRRLLFTISNNGSMMRKDQYMKESLGEVFLALRPQEISPKDGGVIMWDLC